ncbi:unnamed protein product [Pleuronectes platessa]|uniref:Uncharacterized protein n=1 Tax=Pleuronectes platessa TaxID=8262 RepID=A0A9N7UHW9_PLEPL|nr:unnamed protein product [Pleuronectes platessa]
MIVSPPPPATLSSCGRSAIRQGLIEEFFKWPMTIEVALEVQIASNGCCVERFDFPSALEMVVHEPHSAKSSSVIRTTGSPRFCFCWLIHMHVHGFLIDRSREVKVQVQE